MQLSLTGRQFDITDSLKEYVESKIQRIEKHYDNITNVHVILGVEKQIHKAEANVHVSGADIFADAEAHDMYASIDALVDKLIRQVKKHKEKTVDKHQGRA